MPKHLRGEISGEKRCIGWTKGNSEPVGGVPARCTPYSSFAGTQVEHGAHDRKMRRPPSTVGRFAHRTNRLVGSSMPRLRAATIISVSG